MTKERMFIGIVCCILVVCCIVLAGTPQPPPKTAKEEVGQGRVKNHVYSNAYFNNMSITFPKDWGLQKPRVTEKLVNLGEKLFIDDNESRKKQSKTETEKQYVALFNLSKHELIASADHNPNIICIAERVSYSRRVDRGADYLKRGKKRLSNTKLECTFSEDFSTKTFGGIRFDVMNAEIKMGPYTIKQKYLAAIIKDYALTFILCYANDDEEKELLEILETLEFEGKK